MFNIVCGTCLCAAQLSSWTLSMACKAPNIYYPALNRKNLWTLNYHRASNTTCYEESSLFCTYFLIHHGSSNAFVEYKIMHLDVVAMSNCYQFLKCSLLISVFFLLHTAINILWVSTSP